MGTIRVQVHAVQVIAETEVARTLAAKGDLSPEDAFRFFARVKGHPDAASVRMRRHPDAPSVRVGGGSTAIMLGDLLELPADMIQVAGTTCPRVEYTFGLVLEADDRLPDYCETGKLALKLVGRKLTEAEGDALGLMLAEAAGIKSCGMPDVYLEWLPRDVTLVEVTPWRPM